MSTTNEKLRALAARWKDVPAREMANFQPYVMELAEALEVPRPLGGSGYEFEYAVSAIDRASGKDASQRVDLYYRGHFVMEAKHVDPRRPADLVLRAAYQQARSYAYDLKDDLPPFLMVMDVGRRLMVWRLRGARYEDWTNPFRTLDLTRLGESDEDTAFLRALWLAPSRCAPSVWPSPSPRTWPRGWPSSPRRWRSAASRRNVWRGSSCAACSPCSPKTWGC